MGTKTRLQLASGGVMRRYSAKGLVALLRDIWRAMRGQGMIVTVTWSGRLEDGPVEFGQFPDHTGRRLEVQEWHHKRTMDQTQLGSFRLIYHDPEMPVVHKPTSNALMN
jgi:hypothetical protein